MCGAGTVVPPARVLVRTAVISVAGHAAAPDHAGIDPAEPTATEPTSRPAATRHHEPPRAYPSPSAAFAIASMARSDRSTRSVSSVGQKAGIEARRNPP